MGPQFSLSLSLICRLSTELLLLLNLPFSHDSSQVDKLVLIVLTIIRAPCFDLNWILGYLVLDTRLLHALLLLCFHNKLRVELLRGALRRNSKTLPWSYIAASTSFLLL